MHALHGIAEDILAHLPDVVRHFEAVTQQEPWIHLPREYRSNFLSDVIALASRLAILGPSDPKLLDGMLECASRHGEQRLEQGFSDAMLFQELYLAREAVWTFLKSRHANETVLVSEAIVRIDMALSLAAKASLRGYHRPAFASQGRWPAVIHELGAEWSPPPSLTDLERPSEAVPDRDSGGRSPEARSSIEERPPATS